MENYYLHKLKGSSLYTDVTNETESRISGLTCPACGQPEAYVYKNNVDKIFCNRANKCGVTTSTADYLGIHNEIEKDYPPTESDQKRPATVYLKNVRMLVVSLAGLLYSYFPNVRGLGRGAVMFPLGTDESGKDVWSGRIINPPPGEGKTHNIGATTGKFFMHSGVNYNEDKALYVVEGIFDALSLIEMGLNAIAILSANANISKMDLPPHKNLIFFFDNDPAGIKGMKKALKVYPNASAILPPKGKDCNDLLVATGNGEKARERFDDRFAEYRFYANLALAANPKSYVKTYADHYKYLPDLFEFNGCYYSGETTKDGDFYAKKQSNFILEIDHYKKLEDPKTTGHLYHYNLIIKPDKGKARKIVLEGSELATTDMIRKAFLSKGKVLWEGDKAATMALSRKIVDDNKAPVVRQMEFVGYDIVTQGYYFNDFAIDVQGNKLALDDKGFFKVSGNEYVVPFPYATINPSDGTMDMPRIYKLIIDAWGERGAVAMAYTVATWFVHRVKHETAFFPFLSIYGDTQTGKSRMTRLLNYLQAIDEEGMPMLDTNTRKGGLRKISQVSGLFKALIEGNSRDNRSFDYASLLPLYNKGNGLQTTAIRSLDTRTREVPFQGALMFVQNTEPFNKKAEKERVISVHFSSDQITEKTKQAFDELMKIPAQDLANFIIYVLKHRRQFEADWNAGFEKNKKALADIADFRIIENHALILTFHQLLCDILNIDYDLLPYIKDIAELKKASCNTNDNPIVGLFFDQLNEVPEGKVRRFCEVNSEKKQMYIHLPDALKVLTNLGYQQPPSNVLTKELRECSAFINASLKHRFSTDNIKGADGRTRQKRVWVFDIMKL